MILLLHLPCFRGRFIFYALVAMLCLCPLHHRRMSSLCRILSLVLILLLWARPLDPILPLGLPPFVLLGVCIWSHTVFLGNLNGSLLPTVWVIVIDQAALFAVLCLLDVNEVFRVRVMFPMLHIYDGLVW